MPTKTERESWERALVEDRERLKFFGPPAWLVEESRRSVNEDVHAIARRIREELGLVR